MDIREALDMSRLNTWMPLHIADYLADTSRLNTLQHGAYLLLLMELWRNGPMRNDAAELAAVARTDIKTWKKSIWPTIEPFFVVADGRLDQKRSAKERTKAEEISNKRREAVQQRADRKGSKRPTSSEEKTNKKPTNVGSNEDTRALSRDNPHSSPFHSEEPSSLRSEGEREDAPPAPAPKSEKPKRASRLPADWQPTPEQVQFAEDNQVDPVRTAEVFRDYWIGVPGAKGCKADWDATWRNWVRREDGMRSPAAANGGAFRPSRPKTAADRADEHAAYMLEKYAGGVR